MVRTVFTGFLACLMLLVPGAAALAQDDGATPPQLVLCADGGCRYSPVSGELTTQDMTIVLGEADPYGNNVVACTDSDGCQWSAATPQDLDLVYGGDGDLGEGMVFTEDEVEPIEGMIFDEDEVDSFTIDNETIREMIFELHETSQVIITPKSGIWTATHLAGQIVCPGVMTMAIPAGDVQSGNIVVAEDGSTLTAEGLDPELTDVPMRRVTGSAFYGAVTMAVPEQGDVTLHFVEFFLDDGFALGYIYADVVTQGFACNIERYFWTIFEGESLLEPDAPAVS
jgi:hypothetical protein